MKPILAVVAMTTTLAATGHALADGDLSRANVIDVGIEMGSSSDGMYLKPDSYEFVTGQAYRLVLTNVDEIKHELALNEMGERIFHAKDRGLRRGRQLDRRGQRHHHRSGSRSLKNRRMVHRAGADDGRAC